MALEPGPVTVIRDAFSSKAEVFDALNLLDPATSPLAP